MCFSCEGQIVVMVIVGAELPVKCLYNHVISLVSRGGDGLAVARRPAFGEGVSLLTQSRVHGDE